MAIIDRADWYEDEIEREGRGTTLSGATHIGMFLAWIIERKLYSEVLEDYAQECFDDFQDGLSTGRDILESALDGKLDGSILKQEIKEFTEEYYNDRGYIKDYANLFSDSYDSIYAVIDSQKNAQIVMALLDKQLTEWKQMK